jgi:hypothetical protein
MGPHLEQRFEQLAQLISSVSESLHREMQEGFNRIGRPFDAMEAELEGVDRSLQDSDKRMSVLKQRMRDLESGQIRQN